MEIVGWNIRKQYIIDHSNPKGKFSFRIHLKHIFGFCEDYDKILYGMKQTLTLTRNDDNDAIFRANAADAGKIMLDKISWYMPHVMPADREKMELYRIIEKKEKLPVGYRMTQCDSISVNQTSFTWRLGVKSSVSRYSFTMKSLLTGSLIFKNDIFFIMNIIFNSF